MIDKFIYQFTGLFKSNYTGKRERSLLVIILKHILQKLRLKSQHVYHSITDGHLIGSGKYDDIGKSFKIINTQSTLNLPGYI